MRQCEAADSGTGPPLFRPRSYEHEKRRNKKLRSKESWYRPHHDVVGFVPPSPGGELLAGLQKIATEEGKKINMKIKLVEQSGTSVKALLTRPDLSGCLNPGCDIAEDGASHSRRGVTTRSSLHSSFFISAMVVLLGYKPRTTLKPYKINRTTIFSFRLANQDSR